MLPDFSSKEEKKIIQLERSFRRKGKEKRESSRFVLPKRRKTRPDRKAASGQRKMGKRDKKSSSP